MSETNPQNENQLQPNGHPTPQTDNQTQPAFDYDKLANLIVGKQTVAEWTIVNKVDRKSRKI